MPPAIRMLASLKLTVILLIVLAVVLSAGTILESLHGAEAGRAVYYSDWFLGLQALFAVNIAAALWDRWPRNRYRVGFAIAHGSILVVLVGAMITSTSALDGRLPLWEGETASGFRLARHGRPEVAAPLPFRVRLDAYEMDYYPGTQRPAMFRSRVTVLDPSGETRSGVIEMNRPLSHRGYTFFQSSYRIDERGEMSILSVSRDPGQPVVFWGYVLMVFGMIVVLVTRIAQQRMPDRSPAAGGGLDIPIVAPAVAFTTALLALGLAGPALAQHVHQRPMLPPAAVTREARALPVQYDGREMPLDTQAREAVLTVTGQRRWNGVDPVATVIGWTIDPEGWVREPMVRIDRHVAELAGLPPGTRHASFNQLLASIRVRAELGPALDRAAADSPQEPGDKALLKLNERVTVLDAFLRAEGIRVMPGPHRGHPWDPPPQPHDPAAYARLEAQVRPQAPPFYPSRARIAAELRYHSIDPTRIAWWLLLPAAIAAGLTLERDRWRLRLLALVGMLAGFLIMTWGIASRWQIAGRIPASNMYESMLFLGWGVGLFGVISLVLRNRMLIFNAAAMSALVMFLLDRLPIDPFVHPMAPVLSGTPWLAIHVPIIMVSYSTFAIATFLAHMQIGGELFGRSARGQVQKWAQLHYWYLLVGSILLIAGIMTGSIWAAASWGRYWGWDPKEVWSLVAFLAYMAILHARSDGQIGPFGVAVASIVSFWTILMTYLGVNFVLASGLHSYGFGNTNLVKILVAIAAVEAAFLLAAWRARMRATTGAIVAP